MPNYRRAFVPGVRWFFTVNLLERRQTLLVNRIDLLRESVANTRRKYPFEIDAFVVLPEHLHAIWTLPPGDADFSIRWRLIKTAFAKALPKLERLSSSARRATSAASGSGDFGNTRSATRPTTPGTSNIATSTR